MDFDFQEPEWLENRVYGNLRVWHIIFICFGGVLIIVITVCCCIRFRIPRTKQQIEANYQRRKITRKFKKRLEKIHDGKMDTISLAEALELLYGEIRKEMGKDGVEYFAQHFQIDPIEPHQEQNSGQKPEPQASFAKMAIRIANATSFTRSSSRRSSKVPGSPTSVKSPSKISPTSFNSFIYPVPSTSGIQIKY